MIRYEYAGFRYIIDLANGDPRATPCPGQHPAASKEKHRRAALECWVDDGRPGLKEYEAAKAEFIK